MEKKLKAPQRKAGYGCVSDTTAQDGGRTDTACRGSLSMHNERQTTQERAVAAPGASGAHCAPACALCVAGEPAVAVECPAGLQY